MTERVSSDRDRGILTEDDRKFLLGDEEKANLSEGAEYNIRRRIRERVEDSLLDFNILLEELDAADRKKVFSSQHTVRDERPLPTDCVRDVIAFLFLGKTDNTTIEEGDDGHHSPAFELELRLGLERAYRERDLLLRDMDLQIESKRAPDLNAVTELLENDVDVDPGLLAPLIEAGAIDSDDTREFLKEQLVEETPSEE